MQLQISLLTVYVLYNTDFERQIQLMQQQNEAQTKGKN